MVHCCTERSGRTIKPSPEIFIVPEWIKEQIETWGYELLHYHLPKVFYCLLVKPGRDEVSWHCTTLKWFYTVLPVIFGTRGVHKSIFSISHISLATHIAHEKLLFLSSPQGARADLLCTLWFHGYFSLPTCVIWDYDVHVLLARLRTCIMLGTYDVHLSSLEVGFINYM